MSTNLNPATAKKTYNPTTAWSDAAERLELLIDSLAEPKIKFQYEDDGVERIPYTNKQWITRTGKETQPGTGLIWLKEGSPYKAKDRLIHQKPIKYYNGFELKIVSCMYKNTLLCKALGGIGVRMSAVKDTVTYYLKDYTDCPLSVIKRIAEPLAFTAMILIDNYSGHTADELREIDVKYATSRGATDYASREALWKMLKSHGIENLPTRKQQENLIDKLLTLQKFAHLKKTTKTSIIKSLWAQGRLQPTYAKKSDRADEIKEKQAKGIPLTTADRKFKSLHRNLFKNA